MAARTHVDVPVSEEDHLDVDPPIRNQRYACISFMSPEDVLAKKDVFMFQQYMQSVTADLNEMLTNMDACFNPPSAPADGGSGSGGEATERSVPAVTITVEDGEAKAPDAPEADAPAADAPEAAPAAAAETTVASIEAARLRLSQFVKETVHLVRDRYSVLLGDPMAMQAEYQTFCSLKSDALDEAFRAAFPFKTTIRGFKIRGVYDSLDDARKRCKQIEAFDPKFHVFVAEVGCWCPWSPNPDDIQDAVYAETQLNTLMKNYKEGQASRDMAYDERKTMMMDRIAEDRTAWLQTRVKALSSTIAANAHVPAPPPRPAAAEAEAEAEAKETETEAAAPPAEAEAEAEATNATPSSSDAQDAA